MTAIDLSETAIAGGRRKARERGVAVRWIVGNAAALLDSDERFGAVLDCGLLDCCPIDLRPTYLAALQHVWRPGGRVFLLELDARSAELV
ncbi:class I SAM-dependent methyltransferase [Nocardia sp. CA-128927]|uniref:class I SAM-dependent methyltransferase n=1 Tax=Nocardia sp. CA-128927 TaxID=3239975 RepID=UPI003D970F26